MEKKTRKKSKYKRQLLKTIGTLITEGLTNREISELIGLSESTIAAYVLEMLEEHDCVNRTQLAVKIVKGA